MLMVRLRTFLREPLVHFLAIGAALFLYFQWDGGGGGRESRRIVIRAGRIEHLSAGFTKTWQRPPTGRELKGLIDDYVREEIAYREAVATGLDRDDTIIRRRLRQKLEFLVEDAVTATPPSDEELEDWLESHPDAFRSEPRLAFRQVFVNRDRRGVAAEADARALLARLQEAGPDVDISELGDSLMLPDELELSREGDIERLFGEDFTRRLLELEPGGWTGPVESGYGLHLVLVRAREEARLPALADVRPLVERELMAARRKRRLEELYELLLEKYTVDMEGAATTSQDAGVR
jgi:hypothetical protein